MGKLNKCIVCGKLTSNPSWCSEDCVDIWNGDSPRRTYESELVGESPHRKHDPGFDHDDPRL